MKVFTDLHHADLYYSLHLLFEKRLNFELYRPIGTEWFTAGYWKIAEPYGNAQDTINQYLELNEDAWDRFKNLNGNQYVEDDIYYIREPVHDYYQKAITFEKFKSMKFDIIISTISSHDKPYLDLKNNYQKNAKIIAQMGNTGQTTFLPNVIHSVPYRPRSRQNTVFCYQELDLNLYKYTEPNVSKRNVYSVVNCSPFLRRYKRVKKIAKDINMKYYGAGSPDGALFGAKGVGEKMQEANLGWHLKPGGGLGHSAMGWFASGRPVVTNMGAHNSWGGDVNKLYIPGETCIDSDSMSHEELVREINLWLEPENQVKNSEKVYKKFKEVFNYDQQEQDIRKFLERLI